MSAHAIGHNNPPEPTPFERVEKRINDLYDEAVQWFDGEPVTTQAVADQINELINMIRDAAAEAETLRVAEKKPLDEQIKAIQDRYNPLIKAGSGKTARAIDAARKALEPFLKAQAAAKEAAAKLAREEAAAKAQAAQEAFRAAQGDNLAARDHAEELAAEAKRAALAAAKAAKGTATAKGGNGRATALRTIWTPTLDDLNEACRHYFSRPDTRGEFEALVLKLAAADVRAGKRSIPGFTITEDKVAI